MLRDRAWLIKNHHKVYAHMKHYSKDLLDRKFPSSLKYHTLESCKESALLYKNRNEWQKADSTSYQTARRNKWLEECCSHMVAKLKSHTLESCKESALLYKNRNEWNKGDASSYNTASKNKWLEECCAHMKNIHKKEVVNLDTGEIYPSPYSTGYNGIGRAIKKSFKCAGYRWAYAKG